MRTATKEFKWDMAHRLPSHEWKCFNVHGHTYKALITIEWNQLQSEWAEKWMIKDFWNFEPVKKWIDENWDHAYLWSFSDKVRIYLENEWFKTSTINWNPTAEIMAEYLYHKCEELLEWVAIKSVTIFETPTSYATYRLYSLN